MEVAQDPGDTYADDFEKDTGETASKPAEDSKVPETKVVDEASPDDGVSGKPVVGENVAVPETTGGKGKGMDEADSSAVMEEDSGSDEEVVPEVSLRDSGIGLDSQPSPIPEEPEPAPAEEELKPQTVKDDPVLIEAAPMDSHPNLPVQEANLSPDEPKSETTDMQESTSQALDQAPKTENKSEPTSPPQESNSNIENEPVAPSDLKQGNGDLEGKLKAMRGDYEEKVGILELQLDEEREKVEEQARRIKELQKLLRKQQDDGLTSEGSEDIKEKAKAVASLQFERDYLVKQSIEGKSTEEGLRQAITDLLEEKERDQQKIKDLNVRLKRATKDHEAKDKRMAKLQAELRDVTALVTQLEEHMDKVNIEDARQRSKATKTPTAAEPAVTNNNKQSSTCTVL